MTSMTELLKSRVGKIVAIVCLYIAGPLLLMTTNPNSLPLPLLVLPFVWFFLVAFLTMWLILKRKDKITRKQAMLACGSFAGVLVLLAIFQSIHQLSVRDVFISVGLIIVAVIYLLRADFIR